MMNCNYNRRNDMHKELRYLIPIVAAASAFWSADALTGSNDSHDDHGKGHQASGLVKEVVESTRRFREVAVAVSEGYGPFLGCVSGPEEGAMGVDYVNGPLVEDGMLDAAQPEILVYEPQKNGRLRLVAVEYIVIAAAWDAANPNPPVLSGQVFHYSGSPNRYGLPPFYALHAWAWKENPHGMFVDWNPKVSCENYAPEA
jgi:hypothetical protein